MAKNIKNSKVYPGTDLPKKNNPSQVLNNTNVSSSKVFGLTPLDRALLTKQETDRKTDQLTTTPNPTPGKSGERDTKLNPSPGQNAIQAQKASSVGDLPKKDLLLPDNGLPPFQLLDLREGKVSIKAEPEGNKSETKESTLADNEALDKATSADSVVPLPELWPLEDSNMIFVVKQLRHLKLQNKSSVPILQYFKIFNQRGEHVFSAGEVKISHCVKFSKYEFLCFVFTKDGNPLLTIAQLNESYYPCRKKSNQDWLLHRQADGWLNKKFKLLSGEDVDDHVAHVHVSLVTGAFIGHIWDGGDQFVIHDIEYNPSISILHRKFVEPERVVLPQSERKSSGFTESLATSCDLVYELYVEMTQIGEICSNVTLERRMSELGSPKPEDCIGAVYPFEFESEDKAMILAFLLYYVRTSSVCKSCWEIVFSRYCISWYIFIIIATTSLVLLWKF